MSYTKVASLLYNANTSLIRFLYVRSSLQADVQEVYSRNQFTLTFVAIGEGLNIINLTSCIYYRKVYIGIPGFIECFVELFYIQDQVQSASDTLPGMSGSLGSILHPILSRHAHQPANHLHD